MDPLHCVLAKVVDVRHLSYYINYMGSELLTSQPEKNMTRLFMNMDGSMQFDGRLIMVTEPARAAPGGTEYHAEAVDGDDNKYVVTWTPSADWVQSGSTDASVACDWCAPASVRAAILG